ncbi:MAG TPA: pilin [Casimicrobiaceae bacterium]|nr:pilin [Casimicrobiaceae bacterium]
MLEKLRDSLTSESSRRSASGRGARFTHDPRDQDPTVVEPISIPGLADDGERIVRPALFVLFRIAVGPSADYYSPRFLAFERAGQGRIAWHWPALFAPAIWAFYRRLWITGTMFALLPLIGAVLMVTIAPWFDDSTLLWLACAALLTLVAPNVASASLANALLYRRVRRAIRVAESQASSASQVASRVGGRVPVSPSAAMLLGSIAVALMFGTVGPLLVDAYNDHSVRVKVAKAVAGVAPIKDQVEAAWFALGNWPRPTAAMEIPARAGAVLFDEVVVDPATGRVRLAVGPSIPELGGKAILLVPTVDRLERVQWFCVPIGIAERYLPQICRKASR